MQPRMGGVGNIGNTGPRKTRSLSFCHLCPRRSLRHTEIVSLLHFVGKKWMSKPLLTIMLTGLYRSAQRDVIRVVDRGRSPFFDRIVMAPNPEANPTRKEPASAGFTCYMSCLFIY